VLQALRCVRNRVKDGETLAFEKLIACPRKHQRQYTHESHSITHMGFVNRETITRANLLGTWQGRKARHCTRLCPAETGTEGVRPTYCKCGGGRHKCGVGRSILRSGGGISRISIGRNQCMFVPTRLPYQRHGRGKGRNGLALLYSKAHRSVGEYPCE